MRSDRRSITPYGLNEGLNGTPSWNILYKNNNNKQILPVCPMSPIKMFKNDVFVHIQAGAGGYGSPLKRKPQNVLEDYLNELIDKNYAKSVYGVIIKNNIVCENETKKEKKIIK